MPHSRELASKKNEGKDRQSRGPAGSGVANAKKGACVGWGGVCGVGCE